MAKSRRRFAVSTQPLRATAAGLAQKMDTFTTELRRLQNEELLIELAAGRPELFLPLAKKRLEQLRGHPDEPVWKELIELAEVKKQELRWKNKIEGAETDEEKSAVLNDFVEYLKGRLAKTASGSDESVSILQSIGKALKSVKALAEARLDQKAFLKFQESGDISQYSQYLQRKLFSTTDAVLQGKLLEQIQELRTRETKREVASRAKERNNLYADFASEKSSFAETVSGLLILAKSPNFTVEEASSLESTLRAVESLNERRISRAISSGKAAATREASQMYLSGKLLYEGIKSRIETKTMLGQGLTDKDRADLEAADMIFSLVLSKATELNPSRAEDWLIEKTNLPETTAKVIVAAEQRILEREDLLLKDVTTFIRGLSQDPVQRSHQQISKVTNLKNMLDLVKTEASKEKINSAINALEADFKANLSIMRVKKPALSEEQRNDLILYFRDYFEVGGREKETKFLEYLDAAKDYEQFIDLVQLTPSMQQTSTRTDFDKAKRIFSRDYPVSPDILQREWDIGAKLQLPVDFSNILGRYPSSGGLAGPSRASLERLPDYLSDVERFGSIPSPTGVPSLPALPGTKKILDPLDDAFDYLDSTVDINLPGFFLNELPIEDPLPDFDITPYLQPDYLSDVERFGSEFPTFEEPRQLPPGGETFSEF